VKYIAFTLMGILTYFILVVHPNFIHRVHAQTLESTIIYTVHNKDTVSRIALQYGVPESDLLRNNGLDNKQLTSGEKIIIPESISDKDKDLLARLVTAEAKGEPYEGKVAVAAVVLNRIGNTQFPNSIQQVIYQKRQFEPVDNGMINKPAVDDAKKAVNEAIAKKGKLTDALYFYNPKETNSKWLRTRKITEVIGNHRFAI
jgi:N-acetylmuramoyl-L-alanine amidase